MSACTLSVTEAVVAIMAGSALASLVIGADARIQRWLDERTTHRHPPDTAAPTPPAPEAGP